MVVGGGAGVEIVGRSPALPAGAEGARAQLAALHAPATTSPAGHQRQSHRALPLEEGAPHRLAPGALPEVLREQREVHVVADELAAFRQPPQRAHVERAQRPRQEPGRDALHPPGLAGHRPTLVGEGGLQRITVSGSQMATEVRRPLAA